MGHMFMQVGSGANRPKSLADGTGYGELLRKIQRRRLNGRIINEFYIRYEDYIEGLAFDSHWLFDGGGGVGRVPHD